MPELTDIDAIRLAVGYYEKERGFKFPSTFKCKGILGEATDHSRSSC